MGFTDARVGPYRILRLIKRGGQGTVYLGYDARLHRRVAIKICRLPAGRGPRKRLLQEARLVASIDSPKVVKVHDVIQSSEHLALVMEYVPGCDLEEFLQAQSPALASILTVAADVAGALAAARLQHIVHGDLKARNVLISDIGRAKLTDFGIARSVSDELSNPGASGSLSAVSPEQYLGKPLDVRSDLFALGCLIYRMLTGEHPFFRGGQLDARLLLEGSPRPLCEAATNKLDLPKGLVELTDQLLRADPQDRPANTQQVRKVLRGLSREMPLATSDSLLLQARPCFRHESPEDIPPQVPADLGREGRSRVSGPEPTFLDLRHRFAMLGPRARAAALLLALVVGGTLLWVLRSGQHWIHIEEPVLRVNPGAGLSTEISGRWLVQEVESVLSGRRQRARITTAATGLYGTTLYASDEIRPTAAPDEYLGIDLHCEEALCIVALSRRQGDELRREQVMLFPQTPSEQWRELMRSAVRDLYR